MSVLFVLLLILVGVAIGGAGMRRMGAVMRRVTGPWRPGVGVMAMVVLVAAVTLAARGAELPAGGLVVLCLILAVLARRRAPKPAMSQGAAPPPYPASAMSRSEAASILGVPLDAPANAVDEAYRRLMRRAHPDVGGTAGLAAQLNAARATMLAR